MLNLSLDAGQLDEPLTSAQLVAASPSPFDPRSMRALEVAREGWTIRDISRTASSTTTPPLSVQPRSPRITCRNGSRQAPATGSGSPSTSTKTASTPSSTRSSPLQERGLFHHDYEGATLRDHLGSPAQYGITPELPRRLTEVTASATRQIGFLPVSAHSVRQQRFLAGTFAASSRERLRVSVRRRSFGQVNGEGKPMSASNGRVKRSGARLSCRSGSFSLLLRSQ